MSNLQWLWAYVLLIFKLFYIYEMFVVGIPFLKSNCEIE